MRGGLVSGLVAVLLLFGLAPTASAELLSREALGSREAYFERVARLSGQLRADVEADAPREALRQVAVTLAAALTDLAFSEAGARSGKVGPPEDAALRPGEETVREDEAVPGAPVRIAEVPYDWFIERLEGARARARAIVEQLDEEETAAVDVAPSVAAVEILIEEMRRPPRP